MPHSDERSPEQRHHRPVQMADLAELMGAEAGAEPFARSELAAATAEAVIAQGRSGSPGFVDLADRVGLDTLAQLWRDEDPSSLPGALWALYLLRRWCQTNGDEVVRLWRAGRIYRPADEVVAGVADDPDLAAISQVADNVLSGLYTGDLAVALERAAAFFRVIAEGRRDIAGVASDGKRQLELAERNLDVAEGLARAAARWRLNQL